MDANSKLGEEYIPGDPKVQSKNGKLLADVIDENDLILVNGSDKCFGKITRYRKTINGTEESIIDFLIVCRRFFNLINRLDIDEKRIHCLTKYSNKQGEKRVKESDHNLFILNINTTWSTSIDHTGDLIEVYNYKKKEDFQKSVDVTDVNPDLKLCFEDDDFNEACNKWMSILNTSIKRGFRKIRIKKEKIDPELEALFERKENLNTFLTLHDEDEDGFEKNRENLESVLEEIAEICAKKNKDTVREYIGQADDGLEGFNQAKTWTLNKKLSPKNTEDPPMAKKDANGALITDKKMLEKLYLETYVDRLKPNEITPGLEKLESLKEYLFKLRYDICKTKKTNQWTIEDLEKSLKSLKNNKARDAHGHIYEIFKFGGNDLKHSLLKMFNKIK